MGRFSWSQLTEWEFAALERRVPKEIPGLVPRSRLPNNRRWGGKTFGYERNGMATHLNPRFMLRLGLGSMLVLMFYQMWRVPIWGVIEEMEHHSNNFDDIVYDKLSSRNVPYHAAAGFP